MKLPKYQLVADEKLATYKFVSEGPKGRIEKIIQFTLINTQGIYNLSFGDIVDEQEGMDDRIVSNNGDSEKVLATVVSAVFAFFDKNKDVWIFASGSTPSRTRLYQIGINKYYHELSEEFEIFGQLEDNWELFSIGKNYKSFLAKRKN
jgi:hypothetical protein